MLFVSLIGALLLLGGVVYMARAATARGALSHPHREPGAGDVTLEPERRGTGFLGLEANWPGLALVGAGVVLLLVPVVF